MHKYINRVGNYKVNVSKLNKIEKEQLYYSIVYIGLCEEANFKDNDSILTYVSTGYWYIYPHRGISYSGKHDPAYFEKHQNIEVPPEEFLIKDIVCKHITDIPNGMCIRTIRRYSFIKSRYGYLRYNSIKNGFVSNIGMNVSYTYGLYSKSLNPIMIDTFFKGK